ncbi:MAG: O-antigen ligase family protein [Terracidiphilus sp.]
MNMIAVKDKRQDSWLFNALMLGLLCASANLFLMNQRLGAQNGAGQNFVGPRDLFLGLLVILPLFAARGQHEMPALQGAIAKTCIAGIVLAITGFLRGYMLERNVFFLLNELAPFIGWLLPFSVVYYVRNEASLKRLWDMLCVIGVLESVGAIGEIVFQIPLVTGSGIDYIEGSGMDRSTPSGWPIMVLAGAGVLVNILMGKEASSRRKAASFVGLATIIFGSLLTESRTLLVGLWVAFGAVLILAKIGVPRRVTIVLLLASSPLWLIVAGAAGNIFVGEGYSEHFLQRYSVVFGASEAEQYAPDDGRAKEVQAAMETWDQWIFFGTGLAGKYNLTDDPTGDQYNTAGQLAHNNLLFFATRFGILGIVLFMTLTVTILGASARALRAGMKLGGVGCGVGAGMFGLAACSMFADVWSFTYMTPIAMAGVGILLAYWNITTTQPTIQS